MKYQTCKKICYCHRYKQTKPNKNMKKSVILAIAVTLASVGIGFAMNSMSQIKEHGKCEIGHKCSFCSGTGWKGQFKCFHCKGTGANSSY